MKKKRVVITGLGVVSPIGIGLDEYWEGLAEGRNGIGRITKFDASKFDTKFGAEVKDFDPLKYLDKKTIKRLDPFAQFAVVSSIMAVEDSGINLEKVNRDRFGVVFGSGIGGIQTLRLQHFAYFAGETPKKISPFFVPMMISDMAAGQISIKMGLKGPNYATTSACASAAHAITDAFILIERGSADIMICGGSESAVEEMSIGGFNSMRALSTWNDRYKEASRPFDAERNGFVLGEGSGSLVLEEYGHAKKRGAKIYAEICGIGLSADAFHITAPAPGGEGAVRSMREALRDANIQPEQVDYLNAHGTSTPYNDVSETEAVRTVFNSHAYELVISSTKSMTGHLLGAAGAVEAIATILAMKNSKVPPTINLTHPDPECDLNYSPITATDKDIQYAMSNAFGFGGHNASIIFKNNEV